MKAGDRVAMTLHDGFNDREVMCVAVDGAVKSTLMLMTEDGECIATVRQFWRTTQPMLGQDPRSVETLKHEKKTAGTIRRCDAPGCDKSYAVKKADLARGWGKTCSKSCAAKVRELKRNGQ